MGYISNKDGSYYEGDMQYGDLEVPNRPSSTHTWDGIQWNAYVPPPPTPQQQRDAIQAQIDSLERAQLLPRIARDIFILQMEKEAIAIGAAQSIDAVTSLAFAYANNIGYKRLKDFDAQITILRNQMDAIV